MSESWTKFTEKEQRGPKLSMLGSPQLKGCTPGKEGKVAWRHRVMRDQGLNFSTRARASEVGMRFRDVKD